MSKMNYSFPRPLLLAGSNPSYQYHRSDESDQDSDSDMSLPEINEKQSRIQAAKKNIPYWVLPLISALAWFVMLWVLMIVWLVQKQPIYRSMNEKQFIPYISDIGADTLMPLFIIGCVVTASFSFLSLFCIHRNQQRLDRPLDIASIVSSGFGSVALILLSIFDTARYPEYHRGFLFLFMFGVISSAIFTTIEYRNLGPEFIERADLRTSYKIKLIVVVLEILLSIGMIIAMILAEVNVAAIFEWLTALIYTIYMVSFFFDLRPRIRTLGERELLRERRNQNSNRISIFERRNRKPISVQTSA